MSELEFDCPQWNKEYTKGNRGHSNENVEANRSIRKEAVTAYLLDRPMNRKDWLDAWNNHNGQQVSYETLHQWISDPLLVESCSALIEEGRSVSTESVPRDEDDNDDEEEEEDLDEEETAPRRDSKEPATELYYDGPVEAPLVHNKKRKVVPIENTVKEKVLKAYINEQPVNRKAWLETWNSEHNHSIGYTTLGLWIKQEGLTVPPARKPIFDFTDYDEEGYQLPSQQIIGNTKGRRKADFSMKREILEAYAIDKPKNRKAWLDEWNRVNNQNLMYTTFSAWVDKQMKEDQRNAAVGGEGDQEDEEGVIGSRYGIHPFHAMRDEDGDEEEGVPWMGSSRSRGRMEESPEGEGEDGDEGEDMNGGKGGADQVARGGVRVRGRRDQLPSKVKGEVMSAYLFDRPRNRGLWLTEWNAAHNQSIGLSVFSNWLKEQGYARKRRPSSVVHPEKYGLAPDGSSDSRRPLAYNNVYQEDWTVEALQLEMPKRQKLYHTQDDETGGDADEGHFVPQSASEQEFPQPLGNFSSVMRSSSSSAMPTTWPQLQGPMQHPEYRHTMLLPSLQQTPGYYEMLASISRHNMDQMTALYEEHGPVVLNGLLEVFFKKSLPRVLEVLVVDEEDLEEVVAHKDDDDAQTGDASGALVTTSAAAGVGDVAV